MRPRFLIPLVLLSVLPAAACGGDSDDDARARSGAGGDSNPAAETASRGAAVLARGEERLTREQLESGRMDPSWRRVVQFDSLAADTTPNPEEWEDISPQAVNERRKHLPLSGDVAGPSVLAVQILLDRALFSPGIIDGRWGKNTEKAVYWLQSREGLSTTGQVNEETFEKLASLAGNPRDLVRRHTLRAEDVEGPFVEIPDDPYEKAEMDCMCYESLAEKLAEMFHTSSDLLELLNPNADLASLSAGDAIQVPNVRDEGGAAEENVERIVVSGDGYYMHGEDASGRVLYHFPTTLGSEYSPSPTGDYRVTAIAHDPTWHYQPDILEGVDDDEEDAIIPPGPNNAVGVVWMQLSKPHYGIHGTSAPETIGYATSNGCVRLTNWDAEFLADRVTEGTPVEFRDISRDS